MTADTACLLLHGFGVLVRRELEHTVIEEQQADRQIESAAGQHDVQRFADIMVGNQDADTA